MGCFAMMTPLKEPSYKDWPLVNDALLRSIRSELRQNLSSVLNSPDYVVASDVGPPVDEERVDEEEEITFQDFERFYAPTRALMKTFYANDAERHKVATLFSLADSQQSSSAPLVDTAPPSVPDEYLTVPFDIARACSLDEHLSAFHQQHLQHMLDEVENRVARETIAAAPWLLVASGTVGAVLNASQGALQECAEGRKIMQGSMLSQVECALRVEGLRRRAENLAKVKDVLMKLEREVRNNNNDDDDGVVGMSSEMEGLDRLICVSDLRRRRREARVQEEKDALERVVAGVLTGADDLEPMCAALFNSLSEQGKTQDGLLAMRRICIERVKDTSNAQDAPDAYANSLVQIAKRFALVESMFLLVDDDSNTGDSYETVSQAVDWTMALWIRSKTDVWARSRVEEYGTLQHQLKAARDELHQVSGVSKEVSAALEQLDRAFLDALHEHQTQQLTAVLEQERWVTVDVPELFQKLVDELCGVAPGSRGEMPTNRDVLWVGSEGFRVTGSCLTCMQCLSQYRVCMKSLFPSMQGEVMERILRVLRQFNAQAALLVLGAEATRGTAGLKAITAKHLALCGETVGAVAAVATLAFGGNAVAEVVSDYDAHRRDTRVKIVSIMQEMTQSFCQQMKTIAAEWPSKGPEHVSEYVAVIADRSVTLYRLLGGVLPPDRLKLFMSDVVSAIAAKLRSSFAADLTGIASEISRRHVRSDVQALSDRLSKLSGVDLQPLSNIISHVEEIIPEVILPPSTPPTAPPTEIPSPLPLKDGLLRKLKQFGATGN